MCKGFQVVIATVLVLALWVGFVGMVNAAEFYYNCQPTPDGMGVSLCVSCDDHSDELHYTAVTLPDGTVEQTDCRPGPIGVAFSRLGGPDATVKFPLSLMDAAVMGVTYMLGGYPNEIPQDAAELCNKVPDAICPAP